MAAKRKYELEGPDIDKWSAAEVAKYFGVEKSTLYRLIREGKFPRPRLQAGQKVWTGADIAAYELLAERWFPHLPKTRAGKKSSASE